jgi:hypothetical protein
MGVLDHMSGTLSRGYGKGREERDEVNEWERGKVRDEEKVVGFGDRE